MTNSTTFPGTLTCPTSLVSNVMTMGTTKTFVVTMTNASGANKYYIDGYLQASLVLHQGQTYIFDLSSGTLSGHPFEFSTTNNGSHGGGSVYSTGITTTGTYASSEKRTFVVSASTPTTLYYYCTAHSGMGGSVSISSEAELLVSGGAEFIGTGTIKLPSGTTSERPTTGMTGMIRYNTTTGFIETYTAEGWGSIAPPPVITGISPVTVAGADTATQVFTVTGTGFDTGLTIKLVGADDTEYSVFSTTRVSGQSATFKMGANGATDGYDAAQRPFKVKVTGGDTASAVTSTSVASIALVVPTITGISPTTLVPTAVGSQTITVTGTNFASSMASGNNIQVLGADGSTLYNVDSAAVVSATSITFKLAATGASLTTGQIDNRPYKVRVTDAVGITATSTQTIGFTPPTITGISPTTFAYSAVGSQTITVSGTNFASSMASGNNIQVLGADGSTLYNVNSAAVASATSITFKLAATSGSLSTGQLDNRPYKVRVTDAIGITATSTATVGFNGIAWSSPASGATLTYDTGESISNNLVATDDLGGTDVTFSITSGSVAGLSLGSATASPATFSGSGTTDGTTNVTFRVTDNESGTTADRTFSVVVSSALYTFSPNPFTFTAANTEAKTGPTLSTLKSHSSYSSAAWRNDTAFFNGSPSPQSYSSAMYPGWQLWTVPKDGTYRIECAGAQGGYVNIYHISNYGGYGAKTTGDFSFTKGLKIVICVGQPGAYNNGNENPTKGGRSGGGGGASWVLKPANTSPYISNSTIYCIAGGGGGATQGGPHLIANNTAGHAVASQASEITSGGGGQLSNSRYGAAAGSGFFANGAHITNWQGPRRAYEGLNGSIKSPSEYLPTHNSSHGGFGGGGNNGIYDPGGGGGYQGGNSGRYDVNPTSYGGTCRNNGSNVSFANHSGAFGYVKITQL
jgi:hypothetical protein